MEYLKGRQCKKCGERGATVKHIPSKKIYESNGDSTREVMKRECKFCGYTWEETPLDIK